MGELADRLDGMVTEATSPDGQLAIRVRGQGETIELSMRRHAYARYGEAALGHQLSRLAALAFVRYRRDEQEIVDAAFVAAPADDGSGPERRRYLEAVKRLVATGAAADDQITVTTRCLVSWEVTIARGALARLPEREFLDAMVTAFRRTLAHYGAQVFRLKDEIYDLGYPDELRRAVGLGSRGEVD